LNIDGASKSVNAGNLNAMMCNLSLSQVSKVRVLTPAHVYRLDSLHQMMCKATYHFTDKLELCEALMMVIHDSEKHWEITKEDMKMNVIVHVLTPSMTVGNGRKCTAKEQHNMSPPCGILDAFRLVDDSFLRPSSIQCL
jgi:hypothetical protein